MAAVSKVRQLAVKIIYDLTQIPGESAEYLRLGRALFRFLTAGNHLCVDALLDDRAEAAKEER